MRYWKWLVGFALVALVIAASFLPETLPVDMGTVELQDLEITVEEDARTRVRDRYTVYSPVAGMLQRPELRPGDRVVAGETVVAILEPSLPTFLDARSLGETQARLRSAEASQQRVEQLLAGSQEALDFAEKEWARLQRLGDVVSAENLDQAAHQVNLRKTERDAAKRAMSVARFEVETIRATMRPLESSEPGQSQPLILRAPVDGYVFRVFEESGGPVNLKSPLMELADPNQLEIVADLLSKDAVKVKSGQQVHLLHWGGEEKLRGQVRLVEPSGFTKISALGVEEQRVNVIIDLVGPTETWSGMGDGFRVEVAIVVWQGKSVLCVPSSALFWAQDRWCVFAVENEKVVRKEIEVGRRNAYLAQVTDGIEAGAQVVLHPSDQIKEGRKVRPREN